MRIDTLMAADPATCDRECDLGTAIQRMRDHRCGVLPVVGRRREVVGILTDRDAALALGAQNVRPSELTVADVMTPDPRTCRFDATTQQALRLMRDARVRRLPVVDADARLVGIVSIDDIVLVAQNVRAGADRVSFEQVMEAVDAISTRSVRAEEAAP